MTVIELNEKNFQAEALESKIPVLVDFWAPWCGPCKIMGPVIEALAKAWKGKLLKIAKLNIDEASAVASQYKIMSIPTFLLFKNSSVVGQWRGTMAGKDLKKEIEDLL